MALQHKSPLKQIPLGRDVYAPTGGSGVYKRFDRNGGEHSDRASDKGPLSHRPEKFLLPAASLAAMPSQDARLRPRPRCAAGRFFACRLTTVVSGHELTWHRQCLLVPAHSTGGLCGEQHTSTITVGTEAISNTDEYLCPLLSGSYCMPSHVAERRFTRANCTHKGVRSPRIFGQRGMLERTDTQGCAVRLRTFSRSVA